MKVKHGDVLICTCSNCKIELTVTKACYTEKCNLGEECEVNVTCCGNAMELKTELKLENICHS
jgi:hypothetical protein